MAMAAKPGFRRSSRAPNVRSCHRVSICAPPLAGRHYIDERAGLWSGRNSDGSRAGEALIFLARMLGQEHPQRVNAERRAKWWAQQRQESEDQAKHARPRLALE